MKSLLLILAGFIRFLSIQAQPASPLTETWSASPGLHKMGAELNSESAVIILDKRRVEYLDEKNSLVEYRTLHKIVRVNDDKGIESLNQVYLPVKNNSDIIEIKARTILPGGKIIDLDKKNIRDLKDENDVAYKIFAVEGLEKGSEFEYFYTYKRNADFFGREVFQGAYPVMEAKLELVCPQRLVFEIKPFNSLSKSIDTTMADRRMFYATESNVPGVEEEKYVAYEANLKRFEYKLSYNNNRNGNERLLTWDELARRIYANYSNCTKDETKKVIDFVNDMNISSLVTEMDKVLAVENYIKKNISAREDIGGDDAQNLEKIIKTKLADFTGIMKLYGATFRYLNIPFEYVLAGSRDKYSIEKNFENWDNCENYVIYFPSLNKYMAPTKAEYRLPWIEPYWCNTNGFFCKSTTIGNFTTAYADIKPIPMEDYLQTMVNTEADIKLNAAGDTLLVNIKQIYSGYAAAIYRAVYNFSSAENQRLFTKELIKFGTNSENVVSSKMENQDFESYSKNKPFILSAEVKAGELLERAGSKLIVKVGDIIGPQVEMYQEKPRQFPMEIEFPHILQRKISFTIPDGYTVKNAGDINIEHIYQENGQVTMGFSSSYKLEGNLLSINILEQYRKTYYPLSQYEEFKKVINAAADFNKVSLLLEKK